MKLYYSLLRAVVISFCVAGPIYAANQSLPIPQATNLPQKMGEINVISVRGAIHLTLQQTADSSENFYKVMENKKNVLVQMQNGTLYLSAGSNQADTLVTVGLYKLNKLLVSGGASVSSNQLTSSELAINSDHGGDISLKGMIKLNQLISTGSGMINIQWVDSPRLYIEAGDASKIQLAGIANMVQARLKDRSQFQGKYLRIGTIFIQTKDYATAKLLVNDSLRAFAYNHSNIYYYKKPAELTEHTEDSGNVLQLGWGQ
ncbi:MAG: DUF2807 domain-containing protein [Proteobacteria bacterium]|nr:DUF2807 domain-containing protein [Pseudomonadota bacterium]